MYSVLTILAVAACVSGDRLENRYLAPVPANAASAGGGSGDLRAPLNTYLPPQQSQQQQDLPVVIDALRRGAQHQASTQYSSSSQSQGQYPSGGSAQISAQAPTRQVAIIRLANENPGDGNYAFSYETEDGTAAEERGQVRADGAEGSLSAQGSFSFTAPDNVRYSVTYTADENGFQPQGAHLPVPPPIPEAILKALADNAADEARGIVDDGSYREESTSSVNQRTTQQGYPYERPTNGYRY